jgi:hypothetical protein
MASSFREEKALSPFGLLMAYSTSSTRLEIASFYPPVPNRERSAHATNAPVAPLAGTTAVCHTSMWAAWKFGQCSSSIPMQARPASLPATNPAEIGYTKKWGRDGSCRDQILPFASNARTTSFAE